MADLLPCPFCGGEAEPVNASPFDGWHCRCKRCDLEGNEWLDAATAVRAWNRRVPPVAVQEEGDAWQPIETAPKDGTVVLIFVPRSSQGVFCAYWYEANNDSFGDEDYPWVVLDPQGDRELNAWADEHVKRWMPMPAPPAAMKGDQP